VLTFLLLVVILYHGLNLIELPLQNYAMMRCLYLPLAYLPVVPSSSQPLLPAFNHDSLHFFLKILPHAPNAQISDLRFRVDAHFNVVITELQTGRVLFNRCETFESSDLPKEAITAARRNK